MTHSDDRSSTQVQEPLKLPPAHQYPVLLKLDDLRIGRPLDKWKRVFDLVLSLDCKISVGIISEDIDRETNERRYHQNLQWLRQWSSHPSVEFWNHGHTHAKVTYCGPSLEEQIADLKRNEKAVIPAFGQSLNIFGAPFNSVDSTTAHACLATGVRIMFCAHEPAPAELINIPSKWFFQGPEMITGEKTRVPSVVRIERALPNHYADKPLGVIQLHPPAWEEQGFAEFGLLIRKLQRLGHPTTTVAAFVREGKLCSSISS